MFRSILCFCVLGLFIAMVGCVPSSSRLMEEAVRQGGQVAKEKVRSDARKKEAEERAAAEVAKEKERTEAARIRAEAEIAKEQKRTRSSVVSC